ncbi:MAG: GTP-binding protein [Promethearchaeota archaeon]|nr:MAG: GTP-binding protein [Candidatus Lokiarchaeota archaeon]
MSEDKLPCYMMKLVLLGDPAVGKTSLINQYVDHAFERDYSPTLGVNIITKEIELQKVRGSAKLIIWDIAGQNKYDFSRKMFFQGCVGALLVYDITRNSSFKNIEEKWLKDFYQFGEKNSAYLLIGNKIDLKDLKTVKTEQGLELSRRIKACDFIETSAKTGKNVNNAFKNLIYKILSEHWKVI